MFIFLFFFSTIWTWQAVAYRNKSSYIKVYWKQHRACAARVISVNRYLDTKTWNLWARDRFWKWKRSGYHSCLSGLCFASQFSFPRMAKEWSALLCLWTASTFCLCSLGLVRHEEWWWVRVRLKRWIDNILSTYQDSEFILTWLLGLRRWQGWWSCSVLIVDWPVPK